MKPGDLVYVNEKIAGIVMTQKPGAEGPLNPITGRVDPGTVGLVMSAPYEPPTYGNGPEVMVLFVGPVFGWCMVDQLFPA
jgi:hypothetical protein